MFPPRPAHGAATQALPSSAACGRQLPPWGKPWGYKIWRYKPTMKRLFSLLTAFALAAALCAPVMADDVTTPDVTDPTPTPTAAIDTTSSDGVYVSAYSVTDTAGGEVTTVQVGDKINIVLKVVDHASARYCVKPEEISARINSAVFTYTGTGEIGQLFDSNDDPNATRLQTSATARPRRRRLLLTRSIIITATSFCSATSSTTAAATRCPSTCPIWTPPSRCSSSASRWASAWTRIRRPRPTCSCAPPATATASPQGRRSTSPSASTPPTAMRTSTTSSSR